MERLREADDPQQWALHRYRYEVAASFTRSQDTVLDAACGIGYGREILHGKWIGADQEPSPGVLSVDLRTWVPDFEFDVFVGLETIEHLDPFDAYVQTAKQASRIVLSTPIIPTTHFNPFHVHDFTREAIEDLFSDREVVHYETQFDPVLECETYGIWVFGVKVCVYTAIAGGYDTLRPHPEIPDCDFLAFTEGETCEGWEVLPIHSQEHPRMAAKRYKILGPQEELSEYDATIWIDGSHQILTPLFVQEALACLSSPMALHSHPHRDCIYDEARISKGMAKYDGLPIIEQVESYRSEGHPEHWGLWAAGSIARLRSPVVDAVMRDWMVENEQWTYQDQLSLPVVLRRHGLQPAGFPHEQYHSPWLAIRTHQDGT